MRQIEHRLRQAQKTADSNSTNLIRHMVRCTLSDGRVEDMFILDALVYATHMEDLSNVNIEQYVPEDPAADTEPIIIEVEFLDSNYKDKELAKILLRQIEHRKEDRGYEAD